MYQRKIAPLKVFTLFLIMDVFIFVRLSYCGHSCVRPTQVPGTNSVSFDANTGTYNFYLNGSLCYSYTVLPGTSSNGGSFNVLKAYDYSGNYFLPSNFGGITAYLDGASRYPFDQGISYELLNRQILPGDTVLAYWEMRYRGDFIKYKYKFKIAGRTLIIRIAVDSAYSDKALRFELDRCEHAVKPAAIAVPYLPLFYVLYANDMFTSFFTDWQVINEVNISFA